VTHVDQFIDQLLREDRVCDVILPRLPARRNLEDAGVLEPRYGDGLSMRFIMIVIVLDSFHFICERLPFYSIVFFDAWSLHLLISLFIL
jgi:hypothetical protein